MLTRPSEVKRPMTLLCQENQGLGVNCIKLSGLLPGSLLIGFCCHMTWEHSIWVRGVSGRLTWTDEAQTLVKCNWLKKIPKIFNLDSSSCLILEWVRCPRVTDNLVHRGRPSCLRRSQGNVSGSPRSRWNCEKAKSLVLSPGNGWAKKPSQFPCVPAQCSTFHILCSQQLERTVLGS